MRLPDSTDEDVLTSELIVDQIKPFLAGQPFSIQGAVLCQLVALYLAGNPVEIRQTMLVDMAETIMLLAPILERDVFGPAGHPLNGRGAA